MFYGPFTLSSSDNFFVLQLKLINVVFYVHPEEVAAASFETLVSFRTSIHCYSLKSTVNIVMETCNLSFVEPSKHF